MAAERSAKDRALFRIREVEKQINSKENSSYTYKFDIYKYIFYGSSILLVVMGILSIFRYTTFGVFSIDPTTGIIGNIYNTSGLQITPQYTETPIPSNISTLYQKVLQYEYTVGFDVFIKNATPLQNFYRPIFYNGAQSINPNVAASDPSQKNNTGKALSFYGSGATIAQINVGDPSSLASIQEALFNNSSNLCLYMDSQTNDIYLTYYVGHFSRGEGSASGSKPVESLAGWGVSKPITNVPIGTPFRITLVVDSQFIETYINGEMVLITKTFIEGQTSALHSYSSSNNYNFYGPVDQVFLNGTYIANISYWGQILPSKSVRAFSSRPLTTVKYS